MAASVGSGEVNMLEAAQRVWSTLDHMASKDPEKYKKFITEQLDEGKEILASPEPVFCLRCALDGACTKMRYLYINVCKWTRVPSPKTDDDPVPVKGGVLRHLLYKDSSKKSRDMVYDVAFNPGVMEECVKEPDLLLMLTSLCLEYVENEAKLRISDKSSCKKIEVSHKGPLSDIRGSIDENWRHCLRPETLPDIGDSLLSQLKEMRMTNENKEDSSSLPHLKLFPDQDVRAKNPAGIRTTLDNTPRGSSPIPEPESDSSGLDWGKTDKSKKLIQELQSSVLTSYEDTGDGGRVCTPKHSMCITGGGGGEMKMVIVKVTLPGLNSVKEVDLEVSEIDLALSVDQRYHLHLSFPVLVDDERTKATFSSKQHILTVTIPSSRQ